MKAIISHDIDHITVFEHLFKDTIIPKFMLRMHIELFTGKISSREYMLRWSDFLKNKWQNVDELITFNNVNNVPSSFFVAVSKGVGLNYNSDAAMLWIQQIISRRCEIGLHGIAYNNEQNILNEFNRFNELTQQHNFGIRMHYVRNSDTTFEMLSNSGYTYDSTVHAFKNPYKINGMWEFPFQIMDGWIIENYKSWQSIKLEKAKDNTKVIIEKAQTENLKYLGIDFHDRYFSNSFKTWLDWYIWLVGYLKTQGIQCVNFKTAVSELENTM